MQWLCESLRLRIVATLQVSQRRVTLEIGQLKVFIAVEHLQVLAPRSSIGPSLRLDKSVSNIKALE